ncbi:TetR/AcrR family transcriptional regulator [Pararhodobacter oceanensis]|uniref:TetR/AcrR family transcriptional regulator n=1 Tax=Pararhodobacter oceanensis TaxID=2172121 RepID=A0A2T8HPR2_9RHOB|nr:TetR/AcrR family transcriptional regulator [Pararhodobacter oceanensis]PVH27410.1 TetR/AcrR family transcriptional regulator [Pararhodobacter oceanensis]
MGRVTARKIRTRAKLIAAAHKLMSDQGVDRTTIQQITDEADIGFGTFYSYFQSKDEIAEKVLDCVIHNLGQRNRMANQQEGVTDPVAVIGNSVRLTAHEMLSDPMWHWWLKRTDLMVRRMNIGFRSFGLEDMRVAHDAGHLNLPGNDVAAGWSYLIWLLAGTITDITDGVSAPTSVSTMAEAIMRVLGVDAQHAASVAAAPLPQFPALKVDFNFSLNEDA